MLSNIIRDKIESEREKKLIFQEAADFLKNWKYRHSPIKTPRD